MNRVARATVWDGDVATPIGTSIHQGQVPLVVRLKYGAELNGMQVFDDGVAFRSPSPIPVGKLVELILCGGSILVDAEIIECVPLASQPGGFGIRTRYHETSEDMRELIAHEIRLALQRA